MPSQVARSGVSDSMSPGDIAELATSSDLAFKVTFVGEPPPYNSLYWRGLVLSSFDGRTWSQDGQKSFRSIWRYRNPEPGWVEQVKHLGRQYSYSIIQEPTQQNWLFSLMLPELPEDRDIVVARDYRLASTDPLRTKFRYELTSHLNYSTDLELGQSDRAYFTALPEDGLNLRSRELARTLFAESNDESDYIGRVLRRYTDEGFIYTLRPGAAGVNSLDEFLFDSKRGFCEHFAGSFAFMMRAAGIPARVVVGYHGGEYNDFADYIAVFQFDAHAWTEVWLEEEGWRRIDPVTAVAPDRIERGLEAAVEEEATFLADSPFSAFSRQLLWLAEIRLQLSAIGYYWDTFVVGYTPEVQTDLISRFLGEIDRKTLGMIMLATFFSVLGIIGLVIMMKRPRQTMPRLDREYLTFCELLERQGVVRPLGEGPLDYLKRITRERPELSEIASKVTHLYVDLTYGELAGQDLRREQISEFRQTVRTLRLKALTV